MNAREEQERALDPYPQGELQSPFLEGELFGEETEADWEPHLTALEAESPFRHAFEQVRAMPFEPEYEEEEEPSLEGEASYVGEELEDYEEEELEGLEWEDRKAPAEFEEAYEDEKPEDVEEEFEAYEDEGPEEEALTIPYLSEEFSALSSEGGFEPDFEEVLPLLFDAELPATEEEVDEEGELPTDPADGWVIPQDVLRAGENQSVRYDDAPNWDESRRSSICSGRLREGARILRRYLLDNFPGIREIGGYNCRPNSASPHKLSIHGTGRALDIMIPTINGRANNTVGDPIANWLVLNASAIGIQYLIWNRVRWSGGRRRRKFARYTGPNPHRDHIHVELNLDGAQQRMPWFVGRAAPVETAAAKAIDYEKAIRLNRFYGVQLGWQQRLSEITRLLGLASKTPEERGFAEAVARWQREQGLKVDGILGPRTWARMERALPTTEAEMPEDEEETFLDEFDEEDEYILFERQSPPPLRVTKRPRPVPESDRVPFVPTPPRGSYWPIVTSIPQGREVNYLAVDNKGVGSRYGKMGRQFLAGRSGGRYHVGVDLWANFNDPVVACQGGKIVDFYGFCCGKKKTTWALLIDHGDVVVNYGEVAPDSLDRAGGLKIGSQVRAGQLIGFIGRNPGGSSMLHFETYKPDTKKNKRWKKGEKRPNELLNPTEYLLSLAEFGLVGRVPPTTPTATPTRRPTPGAAKPPEELVRFAQRVLNATEGERLDDDGDLGPLTRGALERFRRKYNLGADGMLDDKTQLALAQRALEEIRQQSLFAQPGVLDAATRQELIAFKSEAGLRADDTLDAATRTALTDALALRVSAPSAPAKLVRITRLAAKSEIARYRWRDRGVAPPGYIKGMALVYARVYCKLKAGDAAATEMAKANTGNRDKDALAHYDNEFKAAGMDNNSAGVDTLRHLFVLLIGLGMRESSGRYCAGRDRSAQNITADTAEAGLFQTSYNARTASPLMPRLFERYSANPSGFREIFEEDVKCSDADLENFGEGKGREFQRLSKASPAFATEFTAVGLRNRRRHWGPINRKGAEIRPECDSMLVQVQNVVDKFNLCVVLQ